jgi:hypothetical protein
MSLFNPTPVLFRRALAAATRARRTARGEETWMANPRVRESDDCVIAILLSYAALETVWHWEQIQAEAPVHKWPSEFYGGLCAVAAKRGSPRPDPPDPDLWDRAQDLADWRNFPQHGDARTRARLELRLGPVGRDVLNADLAESSIRATKNLGAYVALATGTQRQLDTNWADPNEL